MGRKSRVARGLDISAAAKKMMEKALGVALTDEEYFTLEHQALESPIERDLEDFTRVYIRELEGEYWFDEYIKPLPAWSIYMPSEYAIARSILIRTPPLPELQDEAKYVAGVTEGDGNFGYLERRPEMYIRAYYSIAMRPKDADVIDYIATILRVRSSYEPHVRRGIRYLMRATKAEGLRAYLTINLMQLHFKSERRRQGAKFVVEKGYVVTPEDRDAFVKIYKPRKLTITASPEEILYYIEPTSQE